MEGCSFARKLTGCSASDGISQLCSKNFCKTMQQLRHLYVISVGAFFAMRKS